MKNQVPENCCEFQQAVDECLLRHRSILDVLSKFQEASTRVNRAVTKAVTECGCVSINAAKQSIPNDCSFSDMRQHLLSHIEGELCETCRDAIELELGRTLFYVAAICNTLDLDLSEIMSAETKRMTTLGLYSMR